MDFDTFKIKYAETMLNYQLIEHDIKCIYAYMLKGNINENFDDIDNKTLGQMVRKLKELDQSDGKPLISAGDYNFLMQICDNRNHWAHRVFTEFIYETNWLNSKKYQKQCDKIDKDLEKIEYASKILEGIRVDYCTRHSR